MKKDNAFIYLGYTSNMVSSGIREIIRYLVEHKLVNVLVVVLGGNKGVKTLLIEIIYPDSALDLSVQSNFIELELIWVNLKYNLNFL